MRLNIPAVFVSGGPMEAGKVTVQGQVIHLDLVDAMVKAVDSSVSDADLAEIERSACPTCGSCSGMFTANSMNCLTEALGLSLPGNGTVVATHADRKELFLGAARLVVELCRRYYEQDDASVLPRSIASFQAFENAMTLDVAMGGSTNTVLHLLAAAQEAGVDFTMADIDRISRQVPCLCKVAPMTDKYHIEDVHRAGGIMGILGELDRAGLLHRNVPTVHEKTLGDAIDRWDVVRTQDAKVHEFFRAGPGGVPTQVAFSQSRRYSELDLDRSRGCIRTRADAYSQEGGLAVLHGNIALDGCIVKTAGVDESIWKFTGRARVFESQDAAVERHSGGQNRGRRRRRHPLRRPEGRPRHAGNALSDLVSQVARPGQGMRAAHRRPFLRRHLRPVDRPCLAGSGRWRRHRTGRGGRHHRNRHPQSPHPPCRDATTNWHAAAPRWKPGAMRRGSRSTASASFPQPCKPMP